MKKFKTQKMEQTLTTLVIIQIIFALLKILLIIGNLWLLKKKS